VTVTRNVSRAADAQGRPQSIADPRPPSAVSAGVGIAGLLGLALWMAIARHFQMNGPFSAITAAVACGVPMVLWSLLVDRVHRNPTTGIDWRASPTPLSATLEVSLAKLAGLWATWAIIAGVYASARFYWVGNYTFAMKTFIYAAPLLFAGSVPYILWLDTRLKDLSVYRDRMNAFGGYTAIFNMTGQPAMSVPQSKPSTTSDRPARLWLSSETRPSSVASASSTGRLTSVSTSCGAAPSHVVRTVIVG
jgi:hypothetical protein